MTSSDGLLDLFDLAYGQIGTTAFWFFLGLSAGITVISYIVGFVGEQLHLLELRRRERRMPQVFLSNSKVFPASANYSGMVSVNVALATDSFRGFSIVYRRIFGGRVKRYERIKDRARREVMLRLSDQALQMNANAIYNIRLESSQIRGTRRRGGGTSVEVLAYGTAMSVGT